MERLDHCLSQDLLDLGYLPVVAKRKGVERRQWHLLAQPKPARALQVNDIEGLAMLVHEERTQGINELLAELDPHQPLALTYLLDLMLDRAATSLDVNAVKLLVKIQQETFDDHYFGLAQRGANQFESSRRGGTGERKHKRPDAPDSDEALTTFVRKLRQEGIANHKLVSTILDRVGPKKFGGERYLRKRFVKLGLRQPPKR